jgi:tRNA(Ile2) C34 agmatinyltransferase TiaS
MIPDCPFCNEKLFSIIGTYYWCKKCHGENFQINDRFAFYNFQRDVWKWKNAEYSRDTMVRIGKLKAFL